MHSLCPCATRLITVLPMKRASSTMLRTGGSVGFHGRRPANGGTWEKGTSETYLFRLKKPNELRSHSCTMRMGSGRSGARRWRPEIIARARGHDAQCPRPYKNSLALLTDRDQLEAIPHRFGPYSWVASGVCEKAAADLESMTGLSSVSTPTNTISFDQFRLDGAHLGCAAACGTWLKQRRPEAKRRKLVGKASPFLLEHTKLKAGMFVCMSCDIRLCTPV